MAERVWFPRGAGQQLGGAILPRCDDPPTTALALDAAQYAAWRPEEADPDGKRP